jgi:hypothetical protein
MKAMDQALLLIYLRLAGIQQGILIDLRVERLAEGMKSYVLLDSYVFNHKQKQFKKAQAASRS